MQLETERLILRSLRKEDVDVMAQLFANPDFMRFSLGVFTERKQTIAFIEKVIGCDHAGIPSQFAVTRARRTRLSVTAVSFIIRRMASKTSRSATDCILITGTAASLLKLRALSVITAFATGGYRA